ncbi:MAG: hypothetical protein BWY75_02039 [bacterium ADurb.Bin425]|nr:MAG: hypothetical protein BWY75_02039 [bacterium ADurb.Bin425]
MNPEPFGYYASRVSKNQVQLGKSLEKEGSDSSNMNCKNGVCELSGWKPGKSAVSSQESADKKVRNSR